MKRGSTLFLKAVILLVGIGALAGMIIFPQLEGRNTNADLFSIYFQDPFLAYVYMASIPFFVALYQAFQLLRYIGQNKVFSPDSVKALRTMKYCAIILSILIVIAALYIRLFHAKGDDPAGFIALCIVTTFISVVIATATAVFEKLLQSAVDIKTENDLTV
jgi:Protein of unknown function (DUF3036).